jgi:hypothetical protein
MDQASPEGVVAPVENAPVVSPDGAAPEAVKPAETPVARPEGDEPKGVAKRLKELTDARRAAEAREARLLALLEQQRAPSQPKPSEEEPLKGLKDFNYDEKAFLDYSEKRAIAKADKAAREIAQRYRMEQEAIGRRAKFDERVAAFANTVEDYHEVVTDSTPVSEGMADAIMDSDEAGALMYYLGNNPDEARKLYQMTPAKAGREIQKLEDRLVAERAKAAAKPVSQAPPPAPKIDAADPSPRVKSTADPDSDKLSDREWFALAEKERLKRRSK